jgi:hypothetical protein
MTTRDILHAVDTKNAYINFNGELVRISESEATRIVQEMDDVIDAQEDPDSVTLFVAGGENTGVPSTLPFTEDISRKKALIELYEAVDSATSGGSPVSLETPVITRYGKAIVAFEVVPGESELLAHYSTGEIETLTGLQRWYQTILPAEAISDAIEDIENAPQGSQG